MGRAWDSGPPERIFRTIAPLSARLDAGLAAVVGSSGRSASDRANGLANSPPIPQADFVCPAHPAGSTWFGMSCSLSLLL